MDTSPDVLTPQRRTIPENIASIKECVGEIAQTERERARELYEHGKDRVHGVELRFEDYVRTRPIRSLLMAAGAGAALGFLLGRRR
jgi:ElaB/YqjD/DUF883 family membrane-anchored ribosome-binding protein